MGSEVTTAALLPFEVYIFQMLLSAHYKNQSIHSTKFSEKTDLIRNKLSVPLEFWLMMIHLENFHE